MPNAEPTQPLDEARRALLDRQVSETTLDEPGAAGVTVAHLTGVSRRADRTVADVLADPGVATAIPTERKEH